MTTVTAMNKPRVRVPKEEHAAEVDILLHKILATPRRHDTESEKTFTAWLKRYLEDTQKLHEKSEFLEHSKGGLSFTLLKPDATASKILFCCHVDTVDPHDTMRNDDKSVPLQPMKKLMYDQGFDHIFLAKDSFGSSLGADDGVGVWIMLRMIDAKVPGTYMFHRGEEVGGVTSGEMARKERPWLEQFKLAIAFDRPNSDEVITHQRNGRCASDKCGEALVTELWKHGNLKYFTSDKGVFTDTANYRDIIPECFNLGVGYTNQHSRAENLDYGHAKKLLETLIKVQWDDLPIERDPKPSFPSQQRFNDYGYDLGEWGSKEFAKKPAPAPAPKPSFEIPLKIDADITLYEEAANEVKELSGSELYELIAQSPDEAYNAIIGLMMQLDAADAKTLRLVRLMA